ncbi:MAG TPA: sugar phosphate isomerase/epimerase [Candidatus Brocadiia bacterium]|nr:sugar phosphate isomerase/epimerase [Candidatus Brocadiia bacterium]
MRGRPDQRPVSVFDWLDMAVSRGLNGVEIMDQWFMPGEAMGFTDHAFMDAVRRRLADLPLEVSAFINHGPFVWRDEPRRRAELDKVRFFMDWAAGLRSRVFRVTTAIGDPASGLTEADAREVFCGMIEQLLPQAKARGMVIGLEEHVGLAATIAKLEPIFHRVPDRAFGFAFDMKNTMRENEDPVVILDKPDVLDRVLYTHVDNYRATPNGWERSIPAQAGEVDVCRLVLGLKAHGYDGWLSVEYGGTNIEHVFQTVEWLRSIW